MPDDKDFIEQLKEIGGLRRDFIDPFRNEDGHRGVSFLRIQLGIGDGARSSHRARTHRRRVPRVAGI